MGWFDRNGLPAADYDDLSAACGAPVRVLAWGRSASGPAVGLADRLAWRGPDGWTFLAWDEVERGGWDPATKRLRWTVAEQPAESDGDGSLSENSVDLVEPGALPDLFRERVAASIVLQQVFELGPKRRALINARRNPGRPDAPVVWRVTLPPGELTEAARLSVDAELARLRTEYDIG